MSPHRAVIEAGPGIVRRLCCGTEVLADVAMSAAALSAMDDPVALVDARPVAVDSLWRSVLRSVCCGGSAGVTVVHPSWWPPARVGLVRAAAKASVRDADDVEVRPRSWLLGRASPGSAPEEMVIVEIGERLVAMVGAGIQAVPRRSESQLVAKDVADVIAQDAAKDVADVIAGMTRGASPVVVIDAPSHIAAATALAEAITDAVRDTARRVLQIDGRRLAGLARPPATTPPPEQSGAWPVAAAPVGFRGRKLAGVGAAGAVLSVLVLALPAPEPVRRHAVLSTGQAPATYLVEGRVALKVPADWPTQRVVDGPGSARIQVTSPADPEVALHVTQSPVVGETLARAAERLKEAIDAEPVGVFVDFNPAGSSAGRPAVTYREVRAAHQVWWTVLLDGTVRISVGCQSRPGDEDAVRGVCDQAVRSAHAVG
ncbi:type VII secretion-associated protein [Mycobacterium sp. 852002-51163_SCH5372311]|uniref:type VII secretion-associated protein n=1 Tax=Mycobacterium sp. 852002-51163_SCH5372311 TaxID=1834097 RepID=UPI0008009B64|nr:type VII secretion-associated protein [Mycobacterium sp. 852002-51163_SCH5372311]OBF80572.1 type VII secretion-associated protein [Mycobacterium sp. 852002-51163_SCH5372311]